MRLALIRKQDNILSLQANANKVDVVEYDDDPMSVFLYALRAPESRRQYPQRLKVFLDYVQFKGPINQQARKFLVRAETNPTWV
jgi:hypothetical protein